MSNYDPNLVRWGQGSAQARGAAVDQGLRAFMLGVYNNMVIGLVLTGVVAYIVHYFAIAHGGDPVAANFRGIQLSEFGQELYFSPLRYVAMFAPLGFVIFFSMKINTMQATTARTLFFVFSAAMGLSLSSILLIYTGNSIYRAFFITAAAFGGLSLYGYTTKRDLAPMGAFLVMGVIGLVICFVVNLFVQSSSFQFALSGLCVLIFSGLTAWDTQAIRQMYFEGDGFEVMTKKSVNGALMLYLDFINIFTALLQLTGDRR